MKIGIISDTHRNIEYIEKAVDWLEKKHKIGMIYHLGDDYEDVNVLAERYIKVVQVPGLYDRQYMEGTVEKSVIEEVLGLRILLVHALEKDAKKQDLQSADLILHGHTHKTELRLENGKFYMNPGHLKGPKDKNFSPSFGFLDIQDKSISAAIFSLDFNRIEKLDCIRAENGLYRGG